MTPAQIERLRELCDNAEKGVLRGAELRELVGLAREAATFASQFAGTCSRCNHESTHLSPLVVDGPNNSRVCLDCFGDVIGEFATAHALHKDE